MTLQLRQVADDDRWLLWEWRNSPRVRRVSTNDQEIPRESHSAWFTRALPAMHDQKLIVEWAQRPVGWIQLEGWDPTTRTGEWGLGLGETTVPGLGGALPLLALGHAFDRLDATALGAEVFDLNPNMVAIMRRFGLPVIGRSGPTSRADGTTATALRYRIEASQWPQTRFRGLGLLPSALRAEVAQALDREVSPGRS